MTIKRIYIRLLLMLGNHGRAYKRAADLYCRYSHHPYEQENKEK